jgi:hypothetical protein
VRSSDTLVLLLAEVSLPVDGIVPVIDKLGCLRLHISSKVSLGLSGRSRKTFLRSCLANFKLPHIKLTVLRSLDVS